MEKLLFMQLEAKIVELSESINDKPNVHQTIRNTMRSSIMGRRRRKKHTNSPIDT